jgi:hypothetical protein
VAALALAGCVGDSLGSKTFPRGYTIHSVESFFPHTDGGNVQASLRVVVKSGHVRRVNCHLPPGSSPPTPGGRVRVAGVNHEYVGHYPNHYCKILAT